MNYCLDFSIRVEDELLRRIAAYCEAEGKSEEAMTQEEEDVLYKEALDAIIEKDEGRTWAAGNVRIGEVILIIDSDTRVVGLFLALFICFQLMWTLARKLSLDGCFGDARKPRGCHPAAWIWSHASRQQCL